MTLSFSFWKKHLFVLSTIFDLFVSQGDGYMGCFKKSILDHNINDFVQQSLSSVTPEKCVAHCKSKMLPYAALSKGDR